MSEAERLGGLTAAIAAELRAEKAARGMSNDDIARASGVSKVAVQRYLRPTRAITVTTLEALCGAVGVDTVELVRRARSRMVAGQFTQTG